MSYISEKRETPIYTATNPSQQQSADRTNGKLFLYNGSHHMVFTDGANGNKEYIFDKSGKKIYLEDIAILQMQNDKDAQQKKLMSSLDEQQGKYEKQKQVWYEKFQNENKKYDLFTAAKKAASKAYQGILSQTGCSSLSDLKSYVQANGGDYLERAKTYLNERSSARAGQISSEAMSAFYGRMYVDEVGNVADVQCQKIIANSIFGC